MSETNETSVNQEILELGVMLGQRRAFGMIAGRCTAAQAESLRRLREEKKYLELAPTWGEFCERHLKVPKRTADRTIAQLKQHGPLFFETAALTGISPAEYERIQDSIQKDGIHAGSDVIALIPENAERAIEAVARLQAEKTGTEAAKPGVSVDEQIRNLEKRGKELCTAFHKTAKKTNLIERQWLLETLKKVQQMVNRLQWEIR